MPRRHLASVILLILSIAFMVDGPVRVSEQQEKLTYKLVLDEASASAGLAPVEMTYLDPPSVLVLLMHSNAGGWYDAYAVRDFNVTNEKGDPLQVHYTVSADQQQTWAITVGSSQSVVIRYEVYVRFFDNKTGGGGAYMGYLAPNYLLSWAGWIFLLPSGYFGPLSVSFDLPQNWIAVTPWAKVGDEFETLAGEEFSTSTIAAGPFMTKTMFVSGTELTVAVHSTFSSATAERIFQYAGETFPYVVRTFGGQPPSPYVVVYTPFPAGGRNDFIEAYNSNGDAIPGFGMTMMYSFLHRLVHTFNGFSPTGMRRQSGAENWFVEGCNVYYDSKIPYMLGYQRDLNWMKYYLQEYEQNYGTQQDRAVAAAGDFSSAEGRSDRVIFLQYHKGALVCMLLDSLITRSTNGRLSFDAVLQEMYRRYGNFHNRFSNVNIQQIASALSGFDFGTFFSHYITGKSRLPLGEDPVRGVGVAWEMLSSTLGPLPGQPVDIQQIRTAPIFNSTTLSFGINGFASDLAGLQPVITRPTIGGGNPGKSVKSVYAVNDGLYLYVMIQMYGAPDAGNNYIMPLDLTGNGHWDYSFGFSMEDVWVYNKTGIPNNQWPDSRLSTPDAIYVVGEIAEIAIPLSSMNNPPKIATITLWIKNGEYVGTGNVVTISPRISTITTTASTAIENTPPGLTSSTLAMPLPPVSRSDSTETYVVAVGILTIIGISLFLIRKKRPPKHE